MRVIEIFLKELAGSDDVLGIDGDTLKGRYVALKILSESSEEQENSQPLSHDVVLNYVLPTRRVK